MPVPFDSPGPSRPVAISVSLQRRETAMSDSKSTLILHCGAREVTREELDRIEPPAETQTWKPIKHAVVLDKVGAALNDAGFHPRAVRMGVSRGDHRLFATIETSTQLNCNSVTL